MDLHIVVAAGREVRGVCGSSFTSASPTRGQTSSSLLKIAGETPGAVANGSVLLITASGSRGSAGPWRIASMAPSTSSVSKLGSESNGVPGWLRRSA